MTSGALGRALGVTYCCATGVMSGALVSVCVQPLDVVRTRIQADATRADVLSMVGTVRTIYAEGGVRCGPGWHHALRPFSDSCEGSL